VNEPKEMLKTESSIEDEEMIWKQFVGLELNKIQHKATNKSWNQTVAPEALQFAFRHAASYLIARLNTARGQEVSEEKPLTLPIPDRPLHPTESFEEVEKTASPETLTPPASETDSSAVPVPPITQDAVAILNAESLIDNEDESWRQFIQDELSKIQPREADKSMISTMAPEVFQFALRHLASYMLSRLKKARKTEGSKASVATEPQTEALQSQKKKRRKKDFALKKKSKRERRRKAGSTKIVKAVKRKVIKPIKTKLKSQKSSASRVLIMKPAKKIA
jgi:hypothetical protein